MPTLKQSSRDFYPIGALILGLSGLLSVLAFDHYYWQLDTLREVWPDFSRGHLLRSAAIALCTSVLCWSACRYARTFDKRTAINPRQDQWPAFERWSVFTGLLAALAIPTLFLLDPPAFSALSLEDQPVEWASAVLLFLCGALFAVAFARSFGNRQITSLIRVTLVAFFMLFLLIGMEETSWFQRVLEISVPDAFIAGNAQGEINLHNFATNLTENAYYFGAFIFLVVLPFMRSLGAFADTNGFFDLFIPRSHLIGIGAVACAYNFDMWNIVFTQVEFFGSVAILITYSMIRARGFERIITAATALLVIVTQGIFLARGEWFERIFEVTEYKELLIPLGFTLFALDVYRRVARGGNHHRGAKPRRRA